MDFDSILMIASLRPAIILLTLKSWYRHQGYRMLRKLLGNRASTLSSGRFRTLEVTSALGPMKSARSSLL